MSWNINLVFILPEKLETVFRKSGNPGLDSLNRNSYAEPSHRSVVTFFDAKTAGGQNVKGVVRSKIGLFKNWICESRRPGRDIAFYPNKIRQKLAEIWRVNLEGFKYELALGARK